MQIAVDARALMGGSCASDTVSVMAAAVTGQLVVTAKEGVEWAAVHATQTVESAIRICASLAEQQSLIPS